MDDSSPLTGAGRPALLDLPIASLTAVQAVQHIRACVAFARTVAAAAEVQIREAAWIVRRDYPDYEAFAEFVGAHGLGDTMDAARAWRYAEEWDVARRNRSLRELAAESPREAVALMGEYSAARDGDAVDELDRCVVDVLSKPKRTRMRLLREMARAQRATEAQRHPDDVARIEALEAEQRESGAVVTHHPATLVGEIVAAERQLADIADRLAEWEAARGNAALPGSHANRAAIACDMAMGALERITETVQIASVPDGAA